MITYSFDSSQLLEFTVFYMLCHFQSSKIYLLVTCLYLGPQKPIKTSTARKSQIMQCAALQQHMMLAFLRNTTLDMEPNLHLICILAHECE